MSGSATVHEWAESVRRFGEEWPARGARVAADVVERYAQADTGGDGSLSNYRGGGIGATVEGGSGEAAAVAAGSMGLWSMLEYGTSAHVIKPRGRFLLTPAGPRRMVQVSGMAARGTWSKGAAAGLMEAERDADAAFEEAMS